MRNQKYSKSLVRVWWFAFIPHNNNSNKVKNNKNNKNINALRFERSTMADKSETTYTHIPAMEVAASGNCNTNNKQQTLNGVVNRQQKKNEESLSSKALLKRDGLLNAQ